MAIVTGDADSLINEENGDDQCKDSDDAGASDEGGGLQSDRRKGRKRCRKGTGPQLSPP